MATKFAAPQGTGGLSFIGGAEKAELIKEGTLLPVDRCYRSADQFNPGFDRFILVVKLDGEERALGFGVGKKDGKLAPTSRDEFLDALIQHLDSEDPEPVSVYLKIVGKNFCSVEVAE